MMRKCQSKNPSQCHIHGLGGKQEQLQNDLNRALKTNDISNAVKIRQEIDSLSDAVEPNKEKGSFFSRFKSSLKKMNENTEAVETTSYTPQSANSAPSIDVQETEPYTGLLTDCGKCFSCDPPPSTVTHFRHLSNGPCERPVPMPVSEVTRKVLSRNLAFNSGRTSEQISALHNKVSSVLEDSSKAAHENGASEAAEEVRDMLWDDFSEKNGNKDTSKGGFASAASTTDLFHALGREKELGWISDDAPGYNYKVASDLKTETLFGNMQQLLSESPSSYARRHEGKH